MALWQNVRAHDSLLPGNRFCSLCWGGNVLSQLKPLRLKYQNGSLLLIQYLFLCNISSRKYFIPRIFARVSETQWGVIIANSNWHCRSRNKVNWTFLISVLYCSCTSVHAEVYCAHTIHPGHAVSTDCEDSRGTSQLCHSRSKSL